MTAPLSRQQRRALKRAAAGVDQITDDDRRWFENHPERQHRIRRMAAAEIATVAAMSGLHPTPPGGARFTLVRKVTSFFRLRIHIHGPADRTGEETSEFVAAALWRHHRARSPEAAAHEDAISAVARFNDPDQPTAGSA